MSRSIALALEKFKKHSGGAESYALSLAETLIQRGWEVHLYAQEWDGFPEEAIFHRIFVPQYLPAWAQMLFFALKHKKMVRKENFDVVVGFGNTIFMNVYQSHGGVHRYSTRRKCFSIRNPLLRSLKRALVFLSLKDKVRNWIESSPFRQHPAPKIIAISQMVVDDFVSFYNIKPADVSLIYNGIDLGKFHPGIRADFRGGLRKELNVADDQVLFLFLSYTLRKKGIYPLIEAAAILDKRHRGRFKIVVVGKEPERSIQEKVHGYGLAETVLFHGPTKNPLLYFANSDVFVLPTYYDTCSLVTIEAMACGVPVITSECNGAAGIIDSGVDGHVIKHPPDPESLARVMEVYLSHLKLLEMSERAAEKAQAYSLAANHEAVIKVCEEAAQVMNNRA